MPSDITRKLLVKAVLQTSEFKSIVKALRSEMDAINEKAKKDALELKKTAQDQSNIIKQQILDQKRLQEEAKTMSALDRAKADWQRKNQEALKTEIQQKVLQTVEIRKQKAEAQEEERLAQAQLRIEQQLTKEQERQEALARKQTREREAQLAKEKQAQAEILERERVAVAQAKIQGVVTQVGQQLPSALTSAQVAQHREILTQKRQELAIMEQQLRVIAAQEGTKKEDLVLAEKQIAEERAKLGLEEAQLRQSEQLLRLQLQRERAQAATVNREDVNRITQHIGFSPYTAPKVGGVTGVGGLLGPSTTSTIISVAEEQKKLGLMQAELRVLADQQEFRKVDIAAVQKVIGEEQRRLGLLTAQLQEQREQSLMGKITSRLGEATGQAGGMLQKVLGGGLFGQIAGGAFTGFVGAELFTGLIEGVHKLGEALVEETGHSRQLRLEFERLATLKGAAPEEMLEKLRASTRGLVADTELYKLANNFLRSGMKASNDQMLDMVGTTLNLGRAMGKSSQEVINSLQRAFLNPQYGIRRLAYVTGIDAMTLRQAMVGLPNTIDPAVRATIMFNSVLAEEHKMLTKVGVVVTTLPEFFEQVRNVQRNFIDDVAQAALGTNSLEESVQRVSTWLVAHQKDLKEWANLLGKDLSNSIKWIIDNLNTLKTVGETVLGLKILKWVADLTGGFNNWGNAVGFVIKQLKGLKTAQEAEAAVSVATGAETAVGTGVATVAEGATGAVVGTTAATAVGEGGLLALAAPIATVVAVVLGLLGLGYLLNKAASKEGFKPEEIEGAQEDYWKARGAASHPAAPPPPPVPLGLQATRGASAQLTEKGINILYPKTPPEDPAVNRAEQMKLMQERMQIALLEAKMKLELVKDTIEKENILYKNQYDAGLISLQTYTEKEKALKQEQLKATIEEINAERKAKLAQLHELGTITIGGQTISVATKDMAEKAVMINKQADLQIETNKLKTDGEIAAQDRQHLNDMEAAYRAYVDAVNKANKAGVDQRLSTLEEEFKAGNVTADSYLEQKKELIQEETDLTVDGLNERLKAAKNDLKEQASINAEIIQAKIDGETKLSKVVINDNEIRLQALENHYTKVTKYLESSAAALKGQVGTQVGAEQIGIQQALLEITQRYITELTAKRSLEQEGSKDWIATTDSIAQANGEVEKIRLQLIQMKDSATPLAGLFGQLSGLFGQFNQSTGMKAVSETFKNIEESMSQIAKFQQAVALANGPKAYFQNIGTSFRDLFRKKPIGGETEKQTAQQIFDAGLSKSTVTVDTFTSTIAALTQQLKDLMDQMHQRVSAAVSGPEATTGVGTDNVPRLGPAATPQLVSPQTISPEIAEILNAPEPTPVLASYQVGTDYVPETGPAILHKGEKVVPAEEVKDHNALIDQFRKHLNLLNMTTSGKTSTSSDITQDLSTGSPMTGTETMVLVMRLLGLGKNIPASIMTGVGGAENTLAGVPQPYQSTANFINNINPSFLISLLTAMKSPVNSPQRRAITSEANQYSSDASTSGYAFSSFLKWIQTSPPITGQSFQFGGPVTQSGLAQVEAGEYVVPRIGQSTSQLGVAQLQSVIQIVMSVFKSAAASVDSLGKAATRTASNLVAPITRASTNAFMAGRPAPTSFSSWFNSTGTSSSQSSNVDDDSSSDSSGDAQNIGSGTTEINSFISSIQKASGGTESFSEKLGGLVDSIKSAVSGIMGVVSAMTSAKTGGQGALQGGLATMQVGSQIGGMFGPEGAVVGAIAGGAGGAIMGGIFGAKEKQLQQDIHKIQDSMQSIVDSMNAGTISMSQAIADMRKERQAAIQMLSQDPKAGKGGGKGGKKGFSPSQGQAVIDQIDQQIGQLVNEQKTLLEQLDEQIAVLSQPTAFQQYASSLDTIIQKYQQFASAAQGSTQAVANAQLYLNESLQQYVQTLSVQLNQAQQQAIQDSLQLLDLEYQRQQIINQEAQQEYDVLTQGVLVRQRTTAMTKGQEIGQLRYQRDMQLQQIDEQIALQQYKVQTEQQIFDLATTRIGLETQLLSLQEAQAGLQGQQTAALLQVVQQLQAGMASGSLMNSITSLSQGGNLPTGTGILTTILGQLGLGGNVPSSILTGTGGATNYLAQIPQPYQSITNFINNIDPNFLQNLWQAMQTAPGSSQRMAALQEAAPYQQDAATSGFDFNSFASWIQSGAAITGTTATVTNVAAPTGSQPLPGGTAFPMPTAPGNAPTSIAPSPGIGGQTPYQSISTPLDDGTAALQTFSTTTSSAAVSLQTLTTNANALAEGMQQGYSAAQIAQGNPTTNPFAVTSTPNQGDVGLSVYPVQPVSTTSTGSPVAMQTSIASTLPSYDTGGMVSETGPAILHAGEQVLTAPVTSLMTAMGGVSNVLTGMVTSFKTSSKAATTPSPNIGGSAITPASNVRLATEQQLTSLAQTRSALEMTVVSARQSQLQMEMEHLANLQSTWANMLNNPVSIPIDSSDVDVEALLQKKYETRGRYGSGGFRREVL
jgi:hypothetical protein